MNEMVDRLQQATLRLSQEGSIKDRLADAYASHLDDVDSDALPETLRSQFVTLNRAMHSERPLPRESAIRASVRKMSNEDARRYAALVVRLFAALAREEGVAGQGNARRARAPGPAPVLQLYASES